VVVVEGFIEGDFLVGVGAEAAHIADHTGVDAAFDFVLGFVVAEGNARLSKGNAFGILDACR
jgi:hypothetical protein